ncbi:MAG: DUF748 domain-containing protein, partial [Nitrospinota bacterium]
IRLSGVRAGAPLDLKAEGACTEPGLVRFSAGALADWAKGRYEGWMAAEPFEVAPFFALAPALENLRTLRGAVGGRATASYAQPGRIEWDADLRANGLAAQVSPRPGEGWRALSLPSASVKSKGRFDFAAQSGEVASLELALPFAKARLREPAKWNAAREDRLHLAAEIADVAEALRWIAALLELPAPQLSRAGKLSLGLLASRGRAPGQPFALRLQADLDPLDVVSLVAWAPLAAWAPPLEGLEPRKGAVGGQLELSWAEAKALRWKADLKAEGLDLGLRAGPAQPWRPLQLAHAAVRTEGWADLARREAEIARLEIELPFAKGRLLEKGSWNLAGQDALKARLQVADAGAALRLVRGLAGLPLGDPGQGGGAVLTLAFARARGKEEKLSISAQGKLDPMDLGVLARGATLPPTVRNLGGKAGGEFEVAFATGQPLRWKTSLSGEKLAAEFRPAASGPWRKMQLALLTLRSEGWLDPKAGSAELALLDAALPFGLISLTRPARWNIQGKDEAEFLLAINDLSAAEVWAGSLVELPVKLGKKGERLSAAALVTRDRGRGNRIGWSARAEFDPLEIGPLVRLGLDSSSFLAGAGGEVSGKVALSYSSPEGVRWETDLKGEGLWVLARGEAANIPLGSASLRSAGRADLESGAVEVARLGAEFPFGSLEVPKPSVWKLGGRDELHLAWNFSDLAPALSAAGAVAGKPLQGMKVAGASRGALSLSRRSPAPFSVQGSAEADLRGFRTQDLPNLEADLAGKVTFDGKDALLDLARAAVRNLARPQDPPAVRVESLTATFAEGALLEGKIVAGRVAARSLGLHVHLDAENQSTFEVLTRKEKVKPVPVPAAPPAPAGPAKEEPKRPPARPSPQAPPARADSLPPERVAENLPELRVERLEVERLDFHFRHEIEKGAAPAAVDREGLRLTVENLDTRMPPGRMDARVRLEGPGQPPALLLDARANPGVTPMPITGALTLRQYDLKPLSPYARHARGTEIQRGALDLDAEFSLKQDYLRAEAKGKVFGLELRPVGRKRLLSKAQELTEGLALDLLRRKRGEIPISIRVQGRVDDPSASIYGLAMDSLLVGVFEKLLDLGGKTRELGGNVTDLLRGVLQGLIPGLQAPPQAQPAPPEPAPQEPAPQDQPQAPAQEEKKPPLKQL